MKHINLIQMLQGCSKRNGMTVSASMHDDGQNCNVKQQTRLTSVKEKWSEKEALSSTCLRSASDALSFRSRYLRYAAVIFCVLVMSVGQAWGTVVSFSATNLNAPEGRTIGSIALSTSTMAYDNSNGLKASGASKAFTLTASGGATISQVLITSTTASRYTAGNITNCTSCTREGNVYTCTISPATSSVTCTNSGGGLNITRIDVTYSGGTSTKRIYMKCGDSWCSSTPRFFAHSWGSADNDLELYAVDGCDPAVYYADIPSGNTSVVFTRQHSSSTGILWSGSNFWNKSDDITIDTNNLFTCTGWNKGVTGTFSGSVAALSVTYNANGATGSAPTDANSYGYGATVTVLGKNTLTKADNMFIGWNTEDDGTGTWYAPGETFTIECANVTLYAQWATELDLKYVWKVTGKFCDDQKGDDVASINMIPTNDYFTLTGTGVKQESGSLNVGKTANNNFLITAKSGYQIKSICFYGKIEDSKAYKTTDNSDWSGEITSTNTGEDAYYSFEDLNSTYFGMKSYGSSGFWIRNMVITIAPAAAACGATQPGTISKGTLSGCTMRLTASGSPASNNTWYWQASSTGTSTSESGATKDVTTPGTYYIRSFYSTGSCWSDAQSITVTAADLTPAAPTALAASSVTAKGVTLTVTDAANTNDYEFYVSTSSPAPGGSTPATHSSNTKSITITNLYAGTTFYAWARAKCGSNKSAWTALTDDSFETSTVSAAYHLTNVTKTSGATSGIGGSTFTAVFSANTDYSMPTPVVTIGGNSATSGTDYTWTAGTGTLTINADKINGDIDITMSSPAAAPSSVSITGNYHIYPGETLELTATPTGGNGPKTYQWQKYMGSKWTDLDGETSNTYTKASVTTSDVGHYRCIVTCAGTLSTTSGQFDVKCLQLYVYYNDNKDLTNLPLTKVDGTHATATVLLSNGTYDYRFKITDGCGNWWGNNGESGMSMSNHDNWSLDGNYYTKLWTSKAGTYRFNLGHDVGLTSYRMSVVFPSGTQAAGYNLYFANDETEWNGSKIYYRIGKSSHNNYWQMNLVPGTANLYKVTTTEYGGFEAWHIANNRCGGNSTSIYKTNTNDDYEASAAMMFNGTDIASTGLTVIPDVNNHWAGTGDGADCEFYGYNTVDGMKTDRVTITEPSNGTITVNYTNTSNVASTLTSGYADLAHTVILTSITATPNTGYDAGAITINGDPYSANYVVTGETTIAASFTATNYTIAYDLAGGSVASPNPTSYTIESSAITLNNPTKTGYTFAGWTGTGLVSATTTVTIAAGSTGNRSYTATWTPIVPSSVSLNKTSTTITVGGTETLTATISPEVVADNTITWSTSDADVATVDGGVVTAVAAGTATITATTHNDKTATCEVTVAAAVTYTVTYEYNGADGGSRPASATGASVTLPNPSKTGYTLQGWYTSSGALAGAATATYNPTSNITLYALWRESCAGGGGGGTAEWSYYFVDPDAATEAGVTNASAIFTSMPSSTSTAGSNMNYTIGEVTLSSAKWKYNNAITSGTTFTTLVVPSGYKATNLQLAVNPGGSNLNVKVYNSSDEEVGASGSVANSDGAIATIGEDLAAGTYSVKATGRNCGRFYAIAVELTPTGGSPTCYYVTYNGNGADGGFTKDEASHPSGSNVTVKTNSFTKTGYTFTGWNTEAEGTGTPYTAGGPISGISGNMILYAQWIESGSTYGITYHCNDATSGCPDNATGQVALPDPLATPTKTNYSFGGWYTNAALSSEAVAGATLDDDADLYAKWTQTITLKTGTQGSGADKTPTVVWQGTALNGFSAHAADGYTLQGYYTAGSGGVKVLNADGTFAAANVTDYITSSKWSRTGAAPTLFAQWVATEDCRTLKYAWKATGKFCDDESTSVTSSDTVRFPANASNLYFTESGTGNTVSAGSSYNIGKTKDNYFLLTAKSGYQIKSICFYGKVQDSSVDYTTDNSTWTELESTKTDGDDYYSFNGINASHFGIKLTATSPKGIWIRNMVIEVCAAGGTTYNVTYNGNDETGGTSPTDATNYNYGGTVTVLGNTGSLVKTNYTFAGWTTNNDGTGSNYVADNTFSITANTTLYAKWTQAVTLDKNGGSTGGSATAVWNATGLTGITHAKPAAGYKLLGYYSAPSDGTKVLNSDGSFAATNVTGYITSGKWSRTSATTLYAEYESAGALTWNLIVDSDTANLSTSTKTSAFTEISTTNMTNAALVGGLTYDKSKKKSSLTGKISTPASYDADKYVKVTFQVASGYKFTPSSIKVIAQPVTSGKDVKLSLTDGAYHSLVSSSATSISGGSTQTVTLAGDGTYFTGTVTLKIYCYGATDAYRLGTPITIEGEIEEACATMPSYTSMSYTTTTFAPNADASGSPITIVGGDNINTYQWKYNTVNDRTSGNNCGTNNASLTPLTNEGAAIDGTRYYWCEMTNEACGITIKSPAVAITVAAAKSDATVAWTDPASTPNYGGGGYTIKATVDQAGWDGNEADLVITAPAGINIYNVTSGTTSSQKWVQADFDVQTSFDRTTYASNIPFTVSAAATATYNAISDDHNVSYSACTGVGEGSSYKIRMRKTVTKDGNYYHCANTDGWISPNINSSYSTGKAGTKMETDFDTVASSNTQYVWVRTYHANVNKVRIYADFRANDMTVSKVYKHTAYFSADSKYEVDYTAVYNDDEENENTGTAAQGYVDITLDEVMAANDILLVKFNDSKVRPLGAIITEGSAGSLNTHLQWSGELKNGATVAKNTTDAYFTYSASKITENTNTLGAITYSSSNTSVATVDATGKVALIAAGETTIKATLAASGCYKKAEISYTLNVTEVACAITAGTLTLTSGTESKCSSDKVTLKLTGFESGATLQWKDGDTNIDDGGNYKIESDGTTSTLTTDQEGTYSVMVTSGCSVRSNRITISNKSTEVGAKRIVKNWYIKNGRPTPDIELWTLQNGAHLSSVAWDPANTTGLTASDFYESDGKVYLKGKEPSSNTSGADINYPLTLTVEDDCGSTTPMSASGQLIYLHHQQNTDKHVLAFVVNGTDKGGFTEGITAAQTTSVPLYNEIAANFDVLATNIYSTDDEQALKEYYSQFDILCVTDYPNTGTKGVNKKSYVDALGALVDIRPILTMEAFVAKLANWKAKGISGTPQSPTTRQYTMLLQCKDHEIFSGTKLTKVGEGDETMYRVSMVDKNQEEYTTLDATYGDGAHADKSGYEYASKPALQGFTFTKEMLDNDLLPLGLIDDGSGNDLQVGIERQTKMEARLMVLGINSYAMERLTDDGQTVVVNALKYLMKKNSEDIADCSNTFVGGDDEEDVSTRYDWNVDSHWSGNAVPERTQKVRIVAPCVIKADEKVHVTGVVIAPRGKYNHGANTANGSLTIAAGGALIVDGKVEAATAPLYTETRPTSPSDLTIQASSTKQGALIFDNDKGETQATVEMYSPSYWEVMEGTNKKKSYWSYVGVPIQDVPVGEYFYGAVTYLYDETSGWIRKRIGSEFHAFEGIGLSLPEGHKETFYGTLASTETKEITLTKTTDVGEGDNLIGNSWTAPIQIGNFDSDDFGSAMAVVSMYKTGRDDIEDNPTVVTATAENDGAVEAGQWVSIPIGLPGTDGYDGPTVIPSMQAFQVTTSSETTLTLDYDKLVRDVTIATDNLTQPMSAPKRKMKRAAKKSLDAMMRVRMSGFKTRADLWIMEDGRFSDEYDNGWEANYIECDNRSPQLYANSEIGKMAFLAKPDIEGTILGIAPSLDGNEYLFTFHYVGDEEFYLNDLKLKQSVLISEEESYSFTYEEGDTNRFYISRTRIDAPQMPTGVENTHGDAVKARKFIYNDKLYIMLNGRVYSAEGQIVK